MATDPFSLLAGAGVQPPSGPVGMTPPSPDAGAMAMPGGIPTPVSPVPATVAPAFDMTGMLSAPQAEPEPVIKKLKPGTELHGRVRAQLDARLKFSRDKMKKHYSRWNFNEQKIQAYAGMNDYDRIVNAMSSSRRGGIGDNRPPEPVSIVVPYSYATIHAAATYVSTVLLGRKPTFPLLAVRGTETERARKMEAALQSQLDASRGAETLWQGIWDSFVYGFGPARVCWEERQGSRIEYRAGVRTQTTGLTFAGNVVAAVPRGCQRSDGVQQRVRRQQQLAPARVHTVPLVTGRALRAGCSRPVGRRRAVGSARGGGSR